jgi:hypothetical protein
MDYLRVADSRLGRSEEDRRRNEEAFDEKHDRP